MLSEAPQSQGNALRKTKASSVNFPRPIWVWLVWDQGSCLAPVCCRVGEEQPEGSVGVALPFPTAATRPGVIPGVCFGQRELWRGNKGVRLQ